MNTTGRITALIVAGLITATAFAEMAVAGAELDSAGRADVPGIPFPLPVYEQFQHPLLDGE